MIPIEHPRLRGYTPLDLITGSYFAITAIILAIGRGRVPHGSTYLIIHLLIIAGIAILGAIPRRGNIVLMFVRDTYTLLALPLLYQDVGILNRAIWPGFFDSIVLNWEFKIFHCFPSLLLREWFPNRVLSEYLHMSYFSYYSLVPILGLWLYLRGREELARVMATTMLLTFSVCYMTFIFFPVAGPYYVFVQDKVGSGVFSPIIHRLLASGASKGTAFPSSHVAAAVTVFFLTLRFERRLAFLVGPICVGIFFGTVYGGFHYAVDALAGLVVGATCALIGPGLHAWLLRTARLGPLRFRFPHLFDPIVRPIWRLKRPVKAPVRPVSMVEFVQVSRPGEPDSPRDAEAGESKEHRRLPLQ